MSQTSERIRVDLIGIERETRLQLACVVPIDEMLAELDFQLLAGRKDDVSPSAAADYRSFGPPWKAARVVKTPRIS